MTRAGAGQDPLRVLMLSWRDEHHPEAGGAEVFLHRVSTSLVARGHEVTVMSARFPGSLPDEPVEGRRMRRRGGRFSVYPRGMQETLATGRRYDVVVDVQNGVPFWAPLVTRTPVVNVVHHVHREQWGEVFDPARARLGWWLESRVAPRVYRSAHYVAVSQATRDDLVGLGVAPERIHLVLSGLDVMHSDEVHDPAGDPQLCVLGRLVPNKRVELAIEALARLLPRHPTLRLEVLGQGYWLATLQQLAADRGVADRVRFAGFVSEEEKVSVLAQSTVHLLPSLKEGWGLAVVEAGAQGTPSIAFRDAGGVTESIIDRVTGLLASDEADFMTQVAAVLDDADLRETLGRKARDHASQFDWDRTTVAFEAVLRTAAATRSR